MMSKRKSLEHRILDKKIAILESTRKVQDEINPLTSLKIEKDIKNEIARLKRIYQNFPREALLDMFANAEVKMMLRWQELRVQTARADALEKEFEEHIKKIKLNSDNKQVKTGKFNPHTKKQNIAKAILDDMKLRLGKLKSEDSREFYRLMNAECRRQKLGEPSSGTLRNYFKRNSGIELLR